MPSRFAEAMAAADVALDAHMGEDVQVTPMRRGDFAAVPDPDRPAFDVTALVVDGDPSSTPIAKMDVRVVHEEWRVEVRRAVLAGRKVRKGDEIVLLERPGSPRIVVTFVERLDRERLHLVCGPLRED